MSDIRHPHDEAGARREAGGSGPADTTTHVRNYGDPAAEYAAARNGAVLASRTDRRFVRVHGRDPVKMMQGLISNDIANAPPDRVVYATVLTPKGRMVADLRVARLGPDLLVDTDAAAAEGLAAHLRKFVPPLFAKFEDAGEAWSQLGVYGPGAAEVLKAVFGVDAVLAEDEMVAVAVPSEAAAPQGTGETGGGAATERVLIVGTSYFDVPGCDVWVPAPYVAGLWQAFVAAGARPVGHATLDVLRIEAGSPRWGAELTETTIPLEAGLRERAISETKGCYTGQEVIIRILHRGHVNWHLRQLRLGDVPAPTPETLLFNVESGKQIGRVTSSAWSPRDGQTIALGYVRREVEPGSDVVRLGSVDGSAVAVVATPEDRG